jgi:hypothetical protein
MNKSALLSPQTGQPALDIFCFVRENVATMFPHLWPLAT